MNIVKDFYHNNNEVKSIKFPHEIQTVNENKTTELLQDFTGERSGFLQVGTKKWFFPSGYQKNAEIYYNFEPRTSDVWVVTFPRSGTTWTQELVWLLANNLNYSKAKEISLDERFPFLEFNSFVHPLVKKEFLEENSTSTRNLDLIETITSPAYQYFAQTTDRRFIKSHLPFELLHPNLFQVGCKIIYIARNPKDVAVSFYHLNRLFRTQGYQNNFPKYWYYFKNGLQPWTPYWSHIEQGWARRDEKNLLFLFYEDMAKDLRKTMIKISDFLEVHYEDSEYSTLEEHLNIDNFRNNPAVNMSLLKELGIIKSDEADFVRKGTSGGWKNYFTKEINAEADEWIEENLKKIGIQFPKI